MSVSINLVGLFRSTEGTPLAEKRIPLQHCAHLGQISPRCVNSRTCANYKQGVRTRTAVSVVMIHVRTYDVRRYTKSCDCGAV